MVEAIITVTETITAAAAYSMDFFFTDIGGRVRNPEDNTTQLKGSPWRAARCTRHLAAAGVEHRAA
jgi:hypothetical protein